MSFTVLNWYMCQNMRWTLYMKVIAIAIEKAVVMNLPYCVSPSLQKQPTKTRYAARSSDGMKNTIMMPGDGGIEFYFYTDMILVF